MALRENDFVYWKALYGDIPLARNESPTEADIIKHIVSSDTEVRPEHKIVGNKAGLDGFQILQQQISEIAERQNSLRESHKALRKRNEIIEESHETLKKEMTTLKELRKKYKFGNC
ncbi:hypothetical protein PISL3812_09361 [Talaromyces islandicus]|uniref:Uncharacterized protein n=1 Tax=Talaromyces islandicus TaxID=28573 RepID=A0A0U1M9I2_TALIS|nr:hypothetical protein PISL3812_09361 [Talaromyces islandicus]